MVTATVEAQVGLCVLLMSGLLASVLLELD